MKHILIMISLGGISMISVSAFAVEQGDCNGSGGVAPVTIQDVICTINIVLGTPVPPLPPLPPTPRTPNPTGILFGGDYPAGNNADCSGVEILAQDCMRAPNGQGGFNFTKLGLDGAPIGIQALAWDASGSEAAGTKWSCVRDNHTGLIWEVKTDDGGIQDKDNTYQWGGLTAIGRNANPQHGTYRDGWNTLVSGVISHGAGGLCHFDDWRVPTIEELTSIVDYGVGTPAINTHYFPNTMADNYWSASPYADESLGDFARQLDFISGSDVTYNRDFSKRVRLVRTGP